VKHKKQHTIPNCYLKAWCDPRTPTGQSAYIWRISKDGSTKRNKAPEKSFTESDIYTIAMPNGERNLTLETTLGRLESDFTQVLTRIRRRENLTVLDRARLCFFTAAMHTRTVAMGEHWKQQQQEHHDKVVALEKEHNAPPVTSLETANMVKYAHQQLIAVGVPVLAPMLFRMRLSILVTNDDVGFITSDTPCVWFNPNWYKMPPLYRSPGLAQSDIEITLPLTPQHVLLISHVPNSLYSDVKQIKVDECNRRTRFHCEKEFVSWKGETRAYLFDLGEQPEDAWEKTPEGKEAIERAEKRREWQTKYDESRRTKEQGTERQSSAQA
jgi:hypothetical protein